MAVKNYEAWSAAIERVVPNSYHARWSPGDLKVIVVAVGNDNRRLLMRLSASEKVSTFRYARARYEHRVRSEPLTSASEGGGRALNSGPPNWDSARGRRDVLRACDLGQLLCSRP